MSLLARLAPHLPYVRRYARALTGDQTTGDHYVRVALEALAAGERQLEESMTPRVALYHVFHAIWCSSGAQLEGPGEDEGYDETTRRLYWAEMGGVRSCDPDGGDVRNIVNTPGLQCQGVGVDGGRGYVFWTQPAENPARLYTARLDGSDLRVVADDLPAVTSIAVETNLAKVYWCSGQRTSKRTGVSAHSTPRLLAW